MGNSKEYVCQYWRDFLDGDGVWICEKTVHSKEEALTWVKESSEERRYYETRIPSLNIMKEQLQCIENRTVSDLPKEIVMDAYQEVVNNLEQDWRLTNKTKDGQISNLPEMHKPLLLLIRKKSGKLVLKTLIYDDWTKNFFKNNDVIAWKLITLPTWISNHDFSRAYPTDILLDGNEPTCELEADNK